MTSYKKKIKENSKSFLNILPEDELINRGMVFFQFPHLMQFYSGKYKSLSHYSLEVARIKNEKLDSDCQIFRKIRDMSLTDDDLHNHVRSMVGDEDAEEFNKVLEFYRGKAAGGWCLLDAKIRSKLKYEKEIAIVDYLKFIQAVCRFDENIIQKHVYEKKETKSDFITDVKKWFCFSESFLTRDIKYRNAEYIISIVMYWAALLEKHLGVLNTPEPSISNLDFIMDIEKHMAGFHENNFSFSEYLPVINKKEEFQSSVNIFLEKVKSVWAGGENKSWDSLYDAISSAIVDKTKCKDEDCFDAVSVRLRRIRKGTSYLTSKVFKEWLSALYDPFERYGPDAPNMVLPVMQLFSNLQLSLIEDGVPSKFIVALFEKYPMYTYLVEMQYEAFSESGLITGDNQSLLNRQNRI